MKVIHANLTYFLKNVSVYSCRMSVHADSPPPKHWFHMVLETRYKHLCHQMKSVSECRNQVHLTNMPLRIMLNADFTCDITGSCELCGGNLVQVCIRAFEEAAAGLDLSSLWDGSFFAWTAEGVLPFTHKSQTSGPLVAFPSLVYLISAPHDVLRAVSVGMASVNRCCPLILHPSSGQRSQQSPLWRLITNNYRFSVKWGYSKLSINMSVQKRKRARGKMGGC